MLRVDPEDIALAGQTQQRPDIPDFEVLTEAMNTLDPRHRAVLVLRYFNDLSYDEIASTLQVPLGTVKSRINHALKRLRDKMEKSE